MAGVSLEAVWKIYPGDVTAVKDFALEIKDKEFIVLVGPSGCGKSTTLRMVAGLEEISRGTVKIGERVVNNVPPKDRDIAMVFQNYALYPHMSVRDNMAFGLKLRKVPKSEIRPRVEQAAKQLGLENLLERKPKALSGGQRQRVALGRAVVRDPAVFLFDEPLSNLDAKMRVEMRAELMHLHERIQTTMLYVTHDQVEAMTLGDRIVVMKDGLMMQAAEPLVVYRYPANLFVARFIGTPPMNLFKGQLLKKEDGSLLFRGEGIEAVLPWDDHEELQKRVDQTVYFGIRPEDLTLKEFAESKDVVFKAQVDVTENLGNEMLVHMMLGDHPFQMRIDPHRRPVLEGELEICPEMSRAHIFDGKSGLNLTVPDFAMGTSHAGDLTAEDLMMDVQPVEK